MSINFFILSNCLIMKLQNQCKFQSLFGQSFFNRCYSNLKSIKQEKYFNKKFYQLQETIEREGMHIDVLSCSIAKINRQHFLSLLIPMVGLNCSVPVYIKQILQKTMQYKDQIFYLLFCLYNSKTPFSLLIGHKIFSGIIL